jgi:EF-P beta-lysylation protein EpmB
MHQHNPYNIVTADRHAQTWKQELGAAHIKVTDLLEQLGLAELSGRCDINPEFRCIAPRSYIDKMKFGDASDPLLNQVLPVLEEHNPSQQSSGTVDPVGDLQAQVSPGLLHKYHGRALLITTAACAVHCRYCFRRNYPYQSASITRQRLNQAIDYLRAHNEIDEIILSGGDPLVMDNEKLADIFREIHQISSIRTLRIHSRLPVVLAGRIDNGLLDLLSKQQLKIVLVIHCNHANELQAEEQKALARLSETNTTLLNQSVLLKGINDDASTLIRLSKRLHECNTLPYYLHQLDAVKGAMHFAVRRDRALELHRALKAELPGYLVPALVEEIPGKPSKTEIFRI